MKKAMEPKINKCRKTKKNPINQNNEYNDKIQEKKKKKMKQFEARMRILFVSYLKLHIPHQHPILNTAANDSRKGKRGERERRERERFKRRHFRIDQSGAVDHNTWGKFQAVWAPCSTLSSSCIQPPQAHYCCCCCCCCC